MPKGLTKADKRKLKEIKEYRRKKYFEVSEEEAIQIWHEVRAGIRERFPNYFWSNVRHQQYVGRAFLDEYQKENPENFPTNKDFKENKLKSLLTYNNGSPYEIFKLCDLADPKSEYYNQEFAETPWVVIRKLPQRFWSNKENRIRATKWLAEIKLKKSPAELTQDDYYNNGFVAVVKNSDKIIFELIREAYPTLQMEDRKQHPFAYWKDREKVDREFDKFMEKLGRVPVYSDFQKHGKLGLLDDIQNFHGGLANYKMSKNLEGKKPWYYWEDKECRIEHIKSAVEAIGKPVEEITSEDLIEQNLGTLITNIYNGSAYSALKEADLVKKPTDMKRVPRHYWRDKKNIDMEFDKLIDLLGHVPTQYEISYSGRSGLLQGITAIYGSLTEYKMKRGFATEKPKGFWKDENNVKKELEKVIKKLGHFPSASQLSRINSSVSVAIYHYHGGLEKFRKKYFPDMPSVMSKRLEERLRLKQIKEERRKRFLNISKEETIQLWYERRRGERKKFPDKFLQNKNHRAYLIQAAVEEFRSETGKRYPTLDYLAKNKLGALINWYYGDSPYLAFIEAGFTDPNSEYYDPELAETPWLALKQLPKNFFNKKEIRVEAIKWLKEEVDGIKNVTADAFEEHGLSGLFQNTYDSSTFKALKEAFPNLTEDDLSRKPAGYWKTKKR